MVDHPSSSLASQASGLFKHPAEESNLVRQIRSLQCSPSHPQGVIFFPVARPGIEPGPTASEAGMRSGTLTGRFRPEA